MKPTAGEWTVDSVNQLVGVQALQIDYTRIATRIADAHNAALAAQQIHNSAAQTRIVNLEAQLAAEREKVKGLHEACRAEAKHSQQLREELAAKDSEIDAWHSQFGTSQLSHAVADRDALRQQLAAEREKRRGCSAPRF